MTQMDQMTQQNAALVEEAAAAAAVAAGPGEPACADGQYVQGGICGRVNCPRCSFRCVVARGRQVAGDGRSTAGKTRSPANREHAALIAGARYRTFQDAAPALPVTDVRFDGCH